MADDKASLIIKVQDESGKPGAPPPPPGLGAESKAPEPGRDPFNLEGLKDFFNKLPDNLIKMLKGGPPGGAKAPDIKPTPSKIAPTNVTEEEWEQNKWLRKVPAKGQMAERWEDVREPGKLAKAHGITPDPSAPPAAPAAPTGPLTKSGRPDMRFKSNQAPPAPPSSVPTKKVPKPTPPGSSPIKALNKLAGVIPRSISGLVAMGAAALGVGAIVGLAGVAIAGLIKVVNALDSAIENATDSYAAFSPEIAISLAERQIKIMEERFRQAAGLAPLMSQYQSTKGDLDVTMMDIKASLLKQIIPIMNDLMKGLNAIMELFGKGLHVMEDTTWLEYLLKNLLNPVLLILTIMEDLVRKYVYDWGEAEDEAREGELTDGEKWMQELGDFFNPGSAAGEAGAHMGRWNAQASPAVSGVF